ncbi:head-tail joining protein [Thiococcus pfennigii]|uniref:head-tail joining protein n=1 Tax=Thiococcus pfennigii TaxID=1057 RepID=UPI001904E532|nr:hypothetical protein [Thiococcus pfennigii]MBK1699750.1 hypothetical protein [Thiococcus pfennigii]
MATLSPARTAAALLARHSTPVLLPGGDVVPGIFDPTGEPAAAPWRGAGLALRIDQQPNPWVGLGDATAAGLAVGDEVIIAGATYCVTATPTADGTGLTRVELAPVRERPTTSDAPWQ